MEGPDLDETIRAICTALPGVTERRSHGAPSYFVGKQFVTLWADGHHDHRWPHLWCAAAPGEQEALVAEEPERYFRPPYVGVRGWIGVRLEEPMATEDLAARCEEAYRAVAPRKLLAELDAAAGASPPTA